jgi:hypothetical protein
MTYLLPRLDRDQTRALIEQASAMSVDEIRRLMPSIGVTTTSSALGGSEAPQEVLSALRAEILTIAQECGYPDGGEGRLAFDARCARLLHDRLDISPHEASEENVWSYLTCCWLMDIASWRWDGGSEMTDWRRFSGDINRNTFRRLWWRAEILGPDVDLAQLGEDELVNIMERPTIASNRLLARTLAAEFIQRTETRGPGRMMLMREAGKRLVRLTPMVDFYALDQADLRLVISDVLDAAAEESAIRVRASAGPAPTPSDGVETVERAPVAAVASEAGSNGHAITEEDDAELFEVAIDIARRTGKVTNASLRQLSGVEPLVARRVLQRLVDREDLARRGKAKGTYYVLPEVAPDEVSAISTETRQASSDTALRRLLRRRKG